MKRIFILISFLLSLFTAAGESSPYKTNIDTTALSHIRESYYVAVETPDSVESLLNYIKSRYSSDTKKYNPIILSYYACLIGLKEKYDANVYNKVKYVNQGISKIESAVSLFPECFEIRFLRFSFYHFLPDFFNVKERRREDSEYVSEFLLKKDYSFVPKKIQTDMISFIVSTDRIDKKTKALLKKASE
ncbi:MAG: hypothetical protein AB7T10_01360 [bacterium]